MSPTMRWWTTHICAVAIGGGIVLLIDFVMKQ